MTSETKKNPFRCFDGPFLLRTLVLAMALLALAFVGKRFPDRTPMRIAIAIAEGVGFAGLIAYTLLRLRRLDELQQRIHLIAIAVSFGVAGALATGSEYLAGAGVEMPPMGVWLWLVMVVVWSVGAIVLARRYR